jgi:mono/diheme cytochrome c family protein
MKKNVYARLLLCFAFLAIILIACKAADLEIPTEPTVKPTSDSSQPQPMMGPGSSMMSRHHATIPSEFSGLSNPVALDEDSVTRGEELYIIHCASCHGDEGQGDGPAGAGLDPLPAPIAHTGSMLGDDYLFWRISEGGALPPFTSAMPSWKAVLEEEQRWDVINFLRVMSGGQPSDEPFDVQAEAEKRAQMLALALEQELISEDEAALFDDVHTKMDVLMAENESGQDSMMTNGQDNVMSRLLADGTISEEEAQAFNDIHDRLLNAGLMR